jgi:hypothetical protein
VTRCVCVIENVELASNLAAPSAARTFVGSRLDALFGCPRVEGVDDAELVVSDLVHARRARGPQHTFMYGGNSGGKPDRIRLNSAAGTTRSTPRSKAAMIASATSRTCEKLGSPCRRAEMTPSYGSSRATSSRGGPSDAPTAGTPPSPLRLSRSAHPLGVGRGPIGTGTWVSLLGYRIKGAVGIRKLAAVTSEEIVFIAAR